MIPKSAGHRANADQRALLGTLFASTGTILLTAGDEFGRSQHGNNNAYAQDNETSWIDWVTAVTARWRRSRPACPPGATPPAVPPFPHKAIGRAAMGCRCQ
jgi:hypothetical protein